MQQVRQAFHFVPSQNGLNSHGNTQKFCRVVNSFSYGNFVGHQSSLKGAALIQGDAGSLLYYFISFFSFLPFFMLWEESQAWVSVFLCSNGLLHIFIIRESLKRTDKRRIPKIDTEVAAASPRSRA